jgi:hypothetical protein
MLTRNSNQCNSKNTISGQVLTPNPTKSINGMEEYEREKTKGGIKKILQELDPITYPYKEDRLIGGNVDICFLSQRVCKKHWRD